METSTSLSNRSGLPLQELPKLCDEKGNIDSTKQSTAKAVFKAYLSGKNTEEIAKELKMPLEEVEELLA